MLLANGRIIGGYASVSWRSNTCSQADANALLFDITNDVKYDQDGTYASGNTDLCQSSGHMATFGGGHDLYANDNWKVYCNLGHTYGCEVEPMRRAHASTSSTAGMANLWQSRVTEFTESWFPERSVEGNEKGVTRRQRQIGLRDVQKRRKD